MNTKPFNFLCKWRDFLCNRTGLPRSGKSQGKTKILQGQGKVREFCKRSGKILEVVKVSEKSGNYIFRQESIMTNRRLE